MGRDDYITTEVLHDFSGRLETLGIDYMLTGSMAMIRYSSFRMTADIDVVVELGPPDTDTIIKEFETDYYVPVNSVRNAIESCGMFNLINLGTSFKVDCIVKKRDAYSVQSFARRQRTDYYGGTIWVISKEDLILSKMAWARDTNSEMQLRDIVNLMRAGFDRDYVAVWIEELEIRTLYERCVENADL